MKLLLHLLILDRLHSPLVFLDGSLMPFNRCVFLIADDLQLEQFMARDLIELRVRGKQVVVIVPAILDVRFNHQHRAVREVNRAVFVAVDDCLDRFSDSLLAVDDCLCHSLPSVKCPP